MAQIYSIDIPGCEGAPITIQLSGIFRGLRLFHGDQEIFLGKSREFLIKRDDGINVSGQLKGNIFDPLPKLIMDGITYEFAPAIPPHAVLWFGLPLLLIPIGGMLGAFIGFIAAYLNLTLYRASFPAAVRYFLGAILTTGALTVYLVVASSIFKEKQPGFAGNGEAGVVRQGAERLKRDHGWVAFDNSTDRDFKVTVLEWEGLTIASEAFVVCQLPKGTYNFTFESDGAALEQIEAEVIPESFVLMNPGAKRDYVLATEFYTAPSRARPQGQREAITGERLIYADFGPEENFPRTIYVKSYLPFLNKFSDHLRTKVYRKIPKQLTATFAIEFIKSGDAAFAEIPPKFDETCWDLIVEGAGDPRVQKGIISLIESGRYIQESFKLLEANKVELDLAMVMAWVKGGEREDTKRASLATLWMVRKGAAAQVVELFESINARHRQAVASALTGAGMEKGLKRELLEKCLKVNDYEADQVARALVDAEGFPFDDAVARLMDVHLESIKAAATSGSDKGRVRLSNWSEAAKKSTIKYASALSPEYLAQRFLPMVKSGDYKAVETLINSGQAPVLVSMFGEFPETMRRNVVHLVQARFYKSKTLSEGESMILQKALEDEKVFSEAFQILTSQARGNPSLLGILAAKVNAEPKPRQREYLDMQLAQAVVKDGKPEALLEIVKAAPTRQIVKMAMLGLGNDGASEPEKLQRFNKVVEFYPRISREEQRIWLLEFLVSRYVRESPAVIGLLNQLIQTAPAQERFAAAKARMQTLCHCGGEIELVGALIAKAKPEEVKELERNYENWVSSGISKIKLEEPGMMTRVLTLAAHTNERIGESAVSKLPYASSKDASGEVFSAMSVLFQKSPSARVRQRLLERMRVETPEGIQICGTALADSDAGIRTYAFKFLANYYGKVRDIAAAEAGVDVLKGVVAAESDAKTKAQMEQAIASAGKNPVLKKISEQ